VNLTPPPRSSHGILSCSILLPNAAAVVAASSRWLDRTGTTPRHWCPSPPRRGGPAPLQPTTGSLHRAACSALPRLTPPPGPTSCSTASGTPRFRARSLGAGSSPKVRQVTLFLSQVLCFEALTQCWLSDWAGSCPPSPPSPVPPPTPASHSCASTTSKTMQALTWSCAMLGQSSQVHNIPSP